jgi:hypothetical protein
MLTLNGQKCSSTISSVALVRVRRVREGLTTSSAGRQLQCPLDRDDVS